MRVYTDEHRKRLGDASRKRWANPDFKAAASNEFRQRWTDPEYRAQQAETRNKNLYPQQPDNAVKVPLPDIGPDKP